MTDRKAGRRKRTAPGSGVGNVSGQPVAGVVAVRRRRPPRAAQITLFVGAVLVLVAMAMAAAALVYGPNPKKRTAVTVTGDGSSHGFLLLKDTDYGFYAHDRNLTCRVLDPSGETVTINDTLSESTRSPRQVLGFRSGDAGLYVVVCNSTSDVTFNVAEISPRSHLFRRVFFASIFVAVAGALLLAASGVQTVVDGRRKRAAQRAGGDGAAPKHPVVPAASDGPPETGGAPDVGAPVQTPPVQAAQAAQAAGPDAGAVPDTPSPQGAANAPASYGLPPQRVVYRPLPPPQGSGD